MSPSAPSHRVPLSPLPRPPYYAVVFTSALAEDEAGEDYGRTAARMVELARKQPGFLGVESVRDGGGHGITVSYWSDESAIDRWRRDTEHLLVQERGRREWYEAFNVHVARVERCHSFRAGPGRPPTRGG